MVRKAAIVVGGLGVSALIISACGGHQTAAAGSTAAPITAQPATTSTKPVKPGKIVLSVADVNALVQQGDPSDTEYDMPTPPETTPRNPALPE